MKSVLTIPKQQLFDQSIIHHANLIKPMNPIDLNSFSYELSDREECETNFEKLQIISYITLREVGSNKIFAYRRGNDSTESRLKGLYSIGLGGHVEQTPSEGQTIVDVLIEDIFRELEEEVGLVRTNNLKKYLQRVFEQDDYKLIYSTDREMDKVHLGLWIVLPIDARLISSKELDIISRSTWMYKSELHLLTRSGAESLETWSAAILQYL